MTTPEPRAATLRERDLRRTILNLRHPYTTSAPQKALVKLALKKLDRLVEALNGEWTVDG